MSIVTKAASAEELEKAIERAKKLSAPGKEHSSKVGQTSSWDPTEVMQQLRQQGINPRAANAASQMAKKQHAIERLREVNKARLAAKSVEVRPSQPAKMTKEETENQLNEMLAACNKGGLFSKKTKKPEAKKQQKTTSNSSRPKVSA